MSPTAKGQARQAVYDALKRMKAEGMAWVTLRGHRLKIIPFEGTPYTGGVTGPVLLRTRRHGGVALGFVVDHDGLRLDYHFSGRRGRADDILALVLEDHVVGP